MKRFAWVSMLLSFAVGGQASGVEYAGLQVPDRAGKIVTVRGEIPAAQSGPALTHEHLFLQFSLPLDEPKRWALSGGTLPTTREQLANWHEPFTARNRSRLLARGLFSNLDALSINNEDDSAQEVLAFRELGGKTLVDLTPIGLGRQPAKLQRLSERTGVQVIMGTAFYRTAWHPADMERRTVDDLTKTFVHDLVVGTEGTDIKAGIIGEIPIEDMVTKPADTGEVRVLRAAARASLLTGAAITLHGDFANMENLTKGVDILQSEGADLSRVVVGHIGAVAARDISVLERLLKRGVYVQFDTLGFPLPWIPDPLTEILEGRPVMPAIVSLLERGYARQLLFSHDMCSKYQFTKYGGYGLTFVHTEVVPYLRSKGIKPEQIQTVLVENPRRVLTFAKPQTLRASK